MQLAPRAAGPKHAGILQGLDLWRGAKNAADEVLEDGYNSVSRRPHTALYSTHYTLRTKHRTPHIVATQSSSRSVRDQLPEGHQPRAQLFMLFVRSCSERAEIFVKLLYDVSKLAFAKDPPSRSPASPSEPPWKYLRDAGEPSSLSSRRSRSPERLYRSVCVRVVYFQRATNGSGDPTATLWEPEAAIHSSQMCKGARARTRDGRRHIKQGRAAHNKTRRR